MNKYDLIKVGDKEELFHVITQNDIEKFIDLSGDNNKIHSDKDFASNTSFKKPVAHGMIGVSFISTIIGMKLPGDGALWYSQNIDFVSPVRVGDRLKILAQVIKKIDRDKTLVISTNIYNQHKQIVTKGTAKVKLVEQLKPTEKKEHIIKNKTALVIGATGGIGEATCIQLAKDGFDIVIHYHSNEKLAGKIKDEILKLGKKAIIVQANIKIVTDVSDMFEYIDNRMDSITALVNCSITRFYNYKYEDLDYDLIEDQLNINLNGVFNLLKYVIPIMKKNNYGKIVNLTTIYTQQPVSELTHYIVAKSALEGLNKSLAIEFASKGIRLNLVSPGMTNTELIDNVPEKAKLINAAKTPLKRLAEPEDVALAISFLASEKSDYLTGETINVNGGQIMS